MPGGMSRLEHDRAYQFGGGAGQLPANVQCRAAPRPSDYRTPRSPLFFTQCDNRSLRMPARVGIGGRTDKDDVVSRRRPVQAVDAQADRTAIERPAKELPVRVGILQRELRLP